MKTKINIAIDGHSSCGKSTLAKALAKELNYVYIDTGAMYRAMTLFALKANIIKDEKVDKDSMVNMVERVYITFKYNTDSHLSETYLNGDNVEKEIRSMQVSKYVSQISEIPEVRQKLVKLQQRMAEFGGVVMDGRDIGTVVIPDAEVKFFMTADPEVRARRRYDELIAKGMEVDFADVLENIITRDELDTSRETDPLRRAEDATVLDNTGLTEEEQFAFAMNHITKVAENHTAPSV